MFKLLRQVDSHKDFMGRIFWESWERQDSLKHFHENNRLRSDVITPAACDELLLLLRHRWNMWTNIIQTTAMLLYPAYLFDEERQETSVHAFIMRHFKKYVRLFGKGVLEKKSDDLEDWINDVHGELDGIACQDASIWTVEHKEKALSSEVKSQPMLWWGQAGRAAPNLRIIAMNILCSLCIIKSIDQKRKRKSARALNIYWKSNVQQSILKRQYGVV
ncbi:hypothetical protein R1sor_008661 [Riccia sorocarpa]|uniref:HAT C-terminal dimerisation domain-containing protein n=1 Tax=Riccia sorocarpa TaxID=122646 RepID=A0ABD3HU21_9MARC